MIEQAPRRGDQNVDAAQELGVLVAERDAADDQGDVEFVVLAVFLELLGHLGGEFAGRLEDQGAWHAGAGAALFEHGQHGQDESGGLAGAGLGDAENVSPGEYVRDGLFLDRGGGLVAGRFNGAEHLVGKAEMGEGHITSSRGRPSEGPAPDDWPAPTSKALLCAGERAESSYRSVRMRGT